MTEFTITPNRERIFACFAGRDFCTREEILAANPDLEGGIASTLSKLESLGYLKLKRRPARHGDQEKVVGVWITTRGREASENHKEKNKDEQHEELPLEVRREYYRGIMPCGQRVLVCYAGKLCYWNVNKDCTAGERGTPKP